MIFNKKDSQKYENLSYCGEYGTTTLQNPIIHKPSIFIQKVNKINALKRLQNKKALNEFE